MAKVYVTLWFDTEDYLLPQSDDAAKRLAEILDQEGVKATFRLVGEKARVLLQRERWDVIEALARHDIGYHSNLHSQHPTVAEYLDGLGWDEGAEEFIRREGEGCYDVASILGRQPSNYGQPGYSWAPQVYPALARLSIPVYICDGGHVGLDEQPFWYLGIFNVLNMGANETRLEPVPDADERAAMAAFRSIHERLLSRGGGTVSIVYHPCEFAHREFWDAVNFINGEQPSRDKWVAPAARDREEMGTILEKFRDYVMFIRDLPDTEFVHPGDLLRLYEDRSVGRPFRMEELDELCGEAVDDIGYKLLGDVSLSAAEFLVLLARSLFFFEVNGHLPPVVTTGYLDPPDDEHPGVAPGSTVPGHLFRSAVADLNDYLESQGKVPQFVMAGSARIRTVDFLATMAVAFKELRATGKLPDEVAIREGRLTAARHVAADDAPVWDWVIFPPSFSPRRLLRLARLGAWTIKPAILHG